MNTKNAFVALVGRPNVGKSTLLNQIIGEKVAIVSDKPQTTRNRITGVITKQETQLVFLDTPGWHNPHNRLSDFMIQEVKSSLADIEVALFLTDPLKPMTVGEEELLENLKLRKIPTILVLNKIDTVKQKELIIPKMQAFSEQFSFAEVIPISARTGEGVSILLEQVLSYAKEGPHFFADDDYTDQPERVIVAEIIREKLLRNLWEELPHGIAVGIDRMEERENKNLIDIDATIFTEKASHKGMIIGKRGAMLKKVATEARADIEKFLDCPVNLQCWVKVKEDWRNRENLMKQFGYNS